VERSLALLDKGTDAFLGSDVYGAFIYWILVEQYRILLNILLEFSSTFLNFFGLFFQKFVNHGVARPRGNPLFNLRNFP
jgi:hypothetical protein